MKRYAKRRHSTKNPAGYSEAIEAFLDTEFCSPVEDVPLNPRCIEIARRFNKTVEEVSLEINRRYLRSWRPMTDKEKRNLCLVEPFPESRTKKRDKNR